MADEKRQELKRDAKRPYTPPEISTSVIHERKALACGKTRPRQASCVQNRKLS